MTVLGEICGLVALLGQRILGLALGYEDLNDHDELRRDRVLSTAMGRVECARSDCEPLAGKSTLNRMELSANGRDPAKARQITVDFDALDELLVELYLVWGERGQMPKRLVLDIDATDVELHGRNCARRAAMWRRAWWRRSSRSWTGCGSDFRRCRS